MTDFTCPFCYIGKKNLDDAIKKLGIEAEIEYHSFQTYPNCLKGAKDSICDVALKNGMTLEQAKEKAGYIENMARFSDLDFKMDNVIMANTFDAHRLTLYAKKCNLGTVMTTRILKAVFIEGKNIGDYKVLAELAEEIGLNYNEVYGMLRSKAMTIETDNEIESAVMNGVSSVPHFVIINQI